MKLFDVDWLKLLKDLPRFTSLPLPARRALLDELTTHGSVPAEKFGPSVLDITMSGIASLDAEHNRLTLADEYRDLLRVLRSMERHPVFATPTSALLLEYLSEHFNQNDLEALGRNTQGHSHVQRAGIAARVAFAGWPGDLLGASTDGARIEWATSVGRPITEVSTSRGLAKLTRLHTVAKKLMNAPDGVPLGDLTRRSSAELADAIHLGLSTLVLFVALRPADLEPMIGLWPAAARELTRPPMKPPTAVVPMEKFMLAVQMEDMTSVLSAVSAAPVRLRSDDMAVFTRERAAIEARMVPVPDWMEHLVHPAKYSRVDAAVRELVAEGLVMTTRHHAHPHLMPTAAGMKWLTLSPHDRLASLVDPIRASGDTNPIGGSDPVTKGRFFPFGLPYYHTPKFLRLRDDLVTAFRQARDGFIPLEDFLAFAEREANPFLKLGEAEERELRHSIRSDGGDPREIYRKLWRSSLLDFLSLRLVRLAGAEVGRVRSGELCFTLTEVGRYLLGEATAFAYGKNEKPDVVVQPNFDIVFLGTAPGTEAMFARFAERVGVSPGLTFRLTRASVLHAAEQGGTADEILRTMSEASNKPLPKNVEREVAGWMATVRRGRLRTLQVVECADVESTDRAAAALGSSGRRLSPTVIEVSSVTAASRAALVKRLRAAGVFLETVARPPADEV